MKLDINLILTVDDGDIIDIMHTAMRGGINYWCSRIKPVRKYGQERNRATILGINIFDHINYGGNLILYDNEEKDELGNPKTYVLTKHKLAKGLKYIVEHHMCDTYMDSKRRLRIDTGTVDINCADVLIQISLFGVVMYS